MKMSLLTILLIALAACGFVSGCAYARMTTVNATREGNIIPQRAIDSAVQAHIHCVVEIMKAESRN